MDTQLKSRFVALYQMVLADGVADPTELSALNLIGINKYGIDPNQINQLIRETSIQIKFPDSLNDKVSLLYQLGEIAWADGRIEDAEKELIKKYIVAMGFVKDNVNRIADFILEQVKNKVPEKEVINKILND